MDELTNAALPSVPPGYVAAMIEELKQHVRVRPVSVHSLDLGALHRLTSQFRLKHHLDGSASQERPPLLLFRQPDQLPTDFLTAERITVFPWCYPGFFGVSMDVTIFTPAKVLGKTRVLVQGAQALLEDIAFGRFNIAFVRADQVTRTFEVDMTHVSRSDGYATQQRTALSERPEWQDVEAHYWEVLLDVKRNWEPYLSISDRLSIGWVEAYRAFARYLVRTLQGLSVLDGRATLPTSTLPPLLRDLVHFAREVKYDPRALLEYAQVNVIRTDRVHDLIISVRDYQGSEWEPFKQLPANLLLAYWHSSAVSRCGAVVPHMSLTGRLETLPLSPDQFDDAKSVEDYWLGLATGAHYMPLSRLISGTDVHLSPPEEATHWEHFGPAADVSELQALCESLLQEAVSNKHWTIPPDAIVDLELGPFKYFEISEIGQDVFFVCRDQRSRVRLISVNPSSLKWNMQLAVTDSNVGSGDERTVQVEAAVQLILAAVIRDFWVVEERESVFATRTRKLGRRSDSGNPRIVYLPRVRYRQVEPNTQRCVETLGLTERRAHFVRAHLRRAASASAEQQTIALRYNFHLPTGYTFVRPHERGKARRDVLYRSRSALRCLYVDDVTLAKHVGHSEWFQFERDVRQLMERLGFDVEHVATSGAGDRGVDVYATKGEDLDRVNWVIQCKCYGPKRKVGPSVIRELVGVLTGYPQGTRGMVTTTSTFTTGAIQEAQRTDIRLMDGVEFVRLLRASHQS